MKNWKSLLPSACCLAMAAVIAFLVLGGRRGGENTGTLKPVDAFTHAHGLAVDVEDPRKLYIATHEGLYVLVDEKDLFQIGDRRDDYMGFSPHPSDPKAFFVSGHPRSGGNFGFLRSDDGGFTWKKLSSGVDGPVDFHAMAVSPVRPELIYGWYNDALQRSEDGGKTWAIVKTDLPPVIALVAHPTEKDAVNAVTIAGVAVSRDKGARWEPLSEALSGAAVTVLAPHPKEPMKMLAFSRKLGLIRSADGGRTWKTVAAGVGGDTVLFIAHDRKNPDAVYALSGEHAVYRSADGGETWSRIR